MVESGGLLKYNRKRATPAKAGEVTFVLDIQDLATVDRLISDAGCKAVFNQLYDYTVRTGGEVLYDRAVWQGLYGKTAAKKKGMGGLVGNLYKSIKVRTRTCQMHMVNVHVKVVLLERRFVCALDCPLVAPCRVGHLIVLCVCCPPLLSRTTTRAP